MSFDEIKERQRQSRASELEDFEWASCSENAFGAFIHVTLQEGLVNGFKHAGYMLTVSACIQGIYGYELLLALPLPLGSSASGFCTSVSCSVRACVCWC